VSRVNDRDNPAYFTDANTTSRMNFVDANLLRLNSSYTENTGCSTKVVGTTSTGELLSCVNGLWKKSGGNGTIVAGGVCTNGRVNITDSYSNLWGGEQLAITLLAFGEG